MFGGKVIKFEHESEAVKTPMVFSAYVPAAAAGGKKMPVIFWLSGLTCTDDNFTHKAGAQKFAEENDVILVAPDTSPRGLDLPGEHDSYDFGSGAGFYLNATQEPWATNYRMEDYIVNEVSLRPLSQRQTLC